MERISRRIEVQEFVKAAPLWSPLTGGGNNSGATAPTSSPSTNLNAIKDFINVNVNMGGIAGSSLGANGNLFIFNPSIKLGAAATSIQYVGAEFDVNALPGSSAIEKHGLVIALAGICIRSLCIRSFPANRWMKKPCLSRQGTTTARLGGPISSMPE